jgi:hypothetical protein
MIDFHFVLLGCNYTILRYKRELIFIENSIKNIVLEIIIAILSNEFSEMTNIQCEWHRKANEWILLAKVFPEHLNGNKSETSKIRRMVRF